MRDFDEMLDEMLDAFPKAADTIDELRSYVHNEGPSEPESSAEDEAEGGEPPMGGMFKPIPKDLQDEEAAEEEDEEAMY